jgi:tetratricopeptide (TPR) repeat protein
MRWCLLLLVGLLGAGPAPAQPDRLDARFRTANEAYEEGRYTRAAEMYEGLLASGSAHAALYYNLANAYVRLERLGPAIRYYEKARRLRPDDPRIQHNLEQARRRAGVYPERLGDTARGLPALVEGWPPWTLLWGGCLLLGLGAVVAVWETRPNTPLPVHNPLVWGAMGAGLLCVVAALSASYLQARPQRAVVVADNTALRGTPSAEVAADTTLPEGALLEVRRRTPQWHEVRLSDGSVGWVPARALGDV